jgi:hypothetical protein
VGTPTVGWAPNAWCAGCREIAPGLGIDESGDMVSALQSVCFPDTVPAGPARRIA